MRISSLHIEKSVLGGFGLGFSNGKAVFVWGTIPGEIIEAKIIHETASHAFAEIVDFHHTSPHRIRPVCPNFGICGGCDYLHVDYEEELDIKKEIIIDSLTRIGKFLYDTIPKLHTFASERFGYRSHADIKFSHSRKVGFYKKESIEVVPFPEEGCSLLAPELVCGIQSCKGIHTHSLKVAKGADGEFHSSLEKNAVIREFENNILFERNIHCFFQSNQFLRSSMAKIVCDYSNICNIERFIDGACGVGFFGLHLAKNAHEGIGFDISKESIVWARHNALLNNMINIHFSAESLSSLHITQGDFAVFLVDPPRAGLSKKARRTIAFLHPQKIVYVSCNPATFSRDARDFVNAGYSFTNAAFIDMFPATKHIELIGLFERMQ